MESIDSAVADIRDGKMIIIVDDDNSGPRVCRDTLCKPKRTLADFDLVTCNRKQMIDKPLMPYSAQILGANGPPGTSHSRIAVHHPD